MKTVMPQIHPTIGVLVYPKGQNPFQDLLYNNIQKLYPNVRIKYFYTSTPKVLMLPIILIIYRFRYKIIHLHWPSFSPKTENRFVRLVGFWYSIFCIQWMAALGYKIVWTIHNIVPHEPLTSNDLAVSKYLAKKTSAKIVHSQAIIKQLNDNNIDGSSCYVIPHGLYDGAYTDFLTSLEARQSLGIKDKETVFLFFGMIRPYKGIEELLEAYTKLDAPRSKLMVVGKNQDHKLDKFIRSYADKENITYINQYIQDSEVERYFKAANYVVLPFKDITNSGSVLLALTFRKTIIAPRIGSIRDLPQQLGIFYDPNEKITLYDALMESIAHKQSQKAVAELDRFVKSNNWQSIARKTLKVYTTVAGSACES